VAKQFAEKHAPSTSAAKACTEEEGFIAALKRCATQNHRFQQTVKRPFRSKSREATAFQIKITRRVFPQAG
jgi:hypothetical protein